MEVRYIHEGDAVFQMLKLTSGQHRKGQDEQQSIETFSRF